MHDCTPHTDCDGCPGRMLCHCLQITEDAVAEAAAVFGLTTVREVRERTGAGDGCTACHRRIRLLLAVRKREQQAQSPSAPSPI